MASWLWLLIGLWTGLGVGMAVTAYLFATMTFLADGGRIRLEPDIKSPQTMLAELVERR